VFFNKENGMEKHSPSAGNTDAGLNKPVRCLINVMTTGFVVLPLLASLTGCEVNDVKFKNAKVSATVDKNEIDAGGQVTLNWSTKDAGTCRFSDGKASKDVPANGKEILTPGVDATYTISCSASGKGKSAEASAQVRVVPLPKASIAAKSAQIYLGDAVNIEWSCSDSEKAGLAINGESTDGLSLAGSDSYSPNEDASFELTCVNKRGKTANAKTKVTVIAETAVKPVFESLAALGQTLDISPMTKDCGTSCIYAPYDLERFDNEGNATDSFRKEIQAALSPAQDKVARAGTRKVSFDAGNTFAYGHAQALIPTELSGRCDLSFPFSAKDAPVSGAAYAEEMEGGTENLGRQTISSQVVTDIEVSTKAIGGVIKKGSEATVSYKLNGISAERIAQYMDYEAATGTYRLNQDGSLKLAEDDSSPRLVSYEEDGDIITTRASSFPADGWLVGPPPAGVNQNDYYPEPPLKNYFGGLNPFQEGCQTNKIPYFQKCIKEDAVRCTYERAQPINQKPGWRKIRSPRIVTALGLVQCNVAFSGVANELGIGGDWTATAEQQYFVYDSAFPSQCQGANCVGKIARDSENDWRFDNVEPASNRCINRWEGLDWNSYYANLQSACFSTQLYKDAAAKKQQNDADESFAADCSANSACASALESMKKIAERFSIKGLQTLVDKDLAEMNKAKSEGRPFLVTESKLSPSNLTSARAEIRAIENGLETALQFHTSRRSNWTSGNTKVHTMLSIQGFDSYSESKDSVIAYKAELERAEALIKPDIRVLGCGYEMRGRFRKYSPVRLGDVDFPVKKQETFKAQVLQDKSMK
jgi:hypothetical protein